MPDHLSMFTEDGHRPDCESYALAGQTDEVPFCRCAADLMAVAERLAAAAAPAEPYEPPGLREIVASITYKRGWLAYLAAFIEDEDEEPRGWRLHIVSDTADSYDPDKRIRVNHAFPVPPASYNTRTWKAWIRDRFADVEAHELGEFLMFDGVREYGPHHGNGEDPYRVWHVGDYMDTRVRAGESKPEPGTLTYAEWQAERNGDLDHPLEEETR